MTNAPILVSLVEHDHTIKVEPVDTHVMRTALAVSKAGAKIIRRYAQTYRPLAAGKTVNADLDRSEYYRFIHESMPTIVRFASLRRPKKITINHKGVDSAGLPYSVSFTIERVKAGE